MLCDFDVAIVGAGPAGAASAILLARQGYRVALIDKAIFPRDKACAEYMSPAIEGILQRLGVLEQVEAAHPAHLLGFDIYSANGRSFRADFSGTRRPDGKPFYKYGLALPRKLLDHLLIEQARREGVQALEATRLQAFQVERVRASETESTLTLQAVRAAGVAGDVAGGSAATTLRTRLLVAADGVHSMIARRLGVQQMSARQRKIALVTHMRGIASLGVYGEMHVGRTSYVGLAPLEPPELGDLCNVAIVVDEREAPSLAGKTEAFFEARLRQFPALVGRLADARRTKPILAVSRLAVRARRYSSDGIMLVGDATGFYDPFTGEGIYRALRGAELLAEVAGAALAAGDCTAARLRAYDRRHRREFAGKRAVEHIVQILIARPALFDHMTKRFASKKRLADTVVGVTGDFLPPIKVLSPVFLAQVLI
jgi:flavin-dependent dehydrogenase